MMWQDFVFMIGSGLSIGFLAPTLRDASARVPLGTSVPSMAIGIVYGITFATLGMTFSALGAFAAGMMWSLIAIVRSPTPDRPTPTRRERIQLLGRDALRWSERRIGRYVPTVDGYRYDAYRHETSTDHARDRGHAAD